MKPSSVVCQLTVTCFTRCFFVNEEKSQWEPTQVITWLAIVMDTFEGSECIICY